MSVTIGHGVAPPAHTGCLQAPRRVMIRAHGIGTRFDALAMIP